MGKDGQRADQRTLTPEEAAALDARLRKVLQELRARQGNPELGAVDVAFGRETDDELDDHIWERLVKQLRDDRDIRNLTADLRAYYVTGLFERLGLHDGPDAFIAAYPALLDLVSPAYRHLGLDGAADAFERYLASAPAQRLIADPQLTDWSEEEHDALFVLWDAIGIHQAQRIAFVRSKPETFSI